MRAAQRSAIEEAFANAQRGVSTRHSSVSARYELEVAPWVRQGSWNYTEGIVRNVGGGKPIAAIRRNFGQFPFAWCENHPTGHDYLIAGEDYQGQTIIELDTGERTDFLASSAQSGQGFCWGRHHVTPDKTVLVVDGCFWARPYELVAFNFSQPMQLPFAELHRWSGDLHTVDGFDAHGLLKWTFEREVRLSDGKPYVDLTDDEESGLLGADGNYLPGLLGTQTYRARWHAGTPFDSTEIEFIESST
jgi:hypothetical protein